MGNGAGDYGVSTRASVDFARWTEEKPTAIAYARAVGAKNYKEAVAWAEEAHQRASTLTAVFEWIDLRHSEDRLPCEVSE